MEKNFKRMIQLAESVFDARHDPEQLDVDEQVIARLEQIHPASVTQLANEDGPYCWILLIPTTTALMNDFISGKISEKELFGLTPVGAKYNSIYLCSAMLLEEFRHKGIAGRAVEAAIREIRKQHTIESLFVWPFNDDGNKSAQAIADKVQLPLLVRDKCF